MTPTDTLYNRVMTLLGADTASLGTLTSPTACTIVLIKDPFVPGPLTRLANVTLADFDGYGALLCSGAPLPNGMQPATGNQVLAAPPNGGGFIWETTGVTNLPQTIYGYGLVGHGPELFASALLPTAQVLNAAGQQIILDTPTITLINGALI